MSYIDLEARYLDAIRAGTQRDAAASEREVARFVAALRPGAIARIRNHWGGRALEDLTRRDTCLDLAPSLEPDAAARAAIADIDASWPDIGPTAQSGMERLLDGWGLVWRDDHGLACNLPLLSALCLTHSVAGECVWLHTHLGEIPTDLARSLAPEAARLTVAQATPAEREAWLASLTPGYSPMLAAALASAVLAEQSASVVARDDAAARIRSVLLDALRSADPGMGRWCAWMVDVPDEAASLRSACPLWLTSTADALLGGILGATAIREGAMDALVRLIASEPGSIAHTALLRGLDLLGAIDIDVLVTAARATAGLSGAQVLESLRPLLVDTAQSVLVDRPAAGSIPWTLLLEAATLPDLQAELCALLDGDEAWDGFDAPGEGELPAFWADVLVIAGLWNDEWRGRLQGRCPEAVLPPVGTSPGDLASRYRSPLAGAEQRLDPEHSPMSAYSHGLHGGVGEAYGDVWSPGDPFSARRRS